MKRALLAALVLSASLVASTPAHAAITIQPGAFMGSSVGGCTMGFIFTGQGNTYVSSAAHCVDKIGDDITLEDGTVFGDVFAIGDASNAATDWSLTKVRSNQLANVSPAMKGHPDMPRAGFSSPSGVAILDGVQMSGYGTIFDLSAATREGRQGVSVSVDAETYTLIGPDVWGDSGGPLVHIKTGRAYGLVSRLCLGLCTSTGPTIQGIVHKAAAAGHPITLKTI